MDSKPAHTTGLSSINIAVILIMLISLGLTVYFIRPYYKAYQKKQVETGALAQAQRMAESVQPNLYPPGAEIVFYHWLDRNVIMVAHKTMMRALLNNSMPSRLLTVDEMISVLEKCQVNNTSYQVEKIDEKMVRVIYQGWIYEIDILKVDISGTQLVRFVEVEK